MSHRQCLRLGRTCIVADPCLCDPHASGNPRPSRPASSTKKPSVLFVLMRSLLRSVLLPLVAVQEHQRQ
eukprot:2029751-Heterocapsa_arctica.AAC.1